MNNIKRLVGKTDLYLLDQILKERYTKSDVILDAGCGSGRNLQWFYNNGFTIYGIDIDNKNIDRLRKKYINQKDNFTTSSIEELSFDEDYFNHIFCNAVLHFATNKQHFLNMFSVLYKLIKPKGTLFIRVASNIGIEDKIVPISEGVYQLPDGTKRYLLTKELLKELQTSFNFTFLEPLKTVNVNDLRCMSTLVIQK